MLRVSKQPAGTPEIFHSLQGEGATIGTPSVFLRLAIELDAPLALTWSCYAEGPRPCGECDSCILRAKGFKDAGVPDPSLARPGQG